MSNTQDIPEASQASIENLSDGENSINNIEKNLNKNKKPIQKRSFVWRFFSKIENECKAECHICNQKVNYTSSTTPLLQHLDKHNVTYERWDADDNHYAYSSDSDNEATEEEANSKNGSPLSEKTLNAIHRALLTFIVKTDQPMSLIENTHFKNLIFKLNKNYDLPSRYTLKNKILQDMVYKNK